MTRTGSCLCGAVQFTATLSSTSLGACHCGMCRKWAGGPYVSVGTTAVDFAPSQSLQTYASSPWAERGFCSACGSSLFYRYLGGGPPGSIHLAAGTLDDLSGLKLEHEVFVDKRPDAWKFAGELKGRTEAQLMGKA